MTIKDIAHIAGVSPSTVSRVLSGNPIISEETTARVKRILEENNFCPNQLAQSLVNRVSNIIAVVLPMVPEKALAEPFLFDVLRGIGAEAGKNGYNMLLSTGVNPEGDTEALRDLISGGVPRGVILLTSTLDDKLAELLKRLRFPFVVLGTPDEPETIRWVDNDNVLAGRSATEHLIKRGCRRIAYVGADTQHRVNIDRQNGWRQALKDYQLPVVESMVVNAEYAENELSSEALVRLFVRPDRPDGVVAASDIQAVGCMNIVSDLALRIPEDVSFISFNNTLAGQYQKPPLTTIDLDPAELGRQCFNLLTPAMADRDALPEHALVPFKLILRESVL